MPRYMTVVFEINDEEKFKEELPDLHAKMLKPKGEPWGVSSVSLSNEILRLELIEQALGEDDLTYLLSNILSTVDIEGKKLEDFISEGS